MTETAQTNGTALDQPEEDRDLSGEICNPLQQIDHGQIWRLIKRAEKYAQKSQNKIKRALERGQGAKARELQHRYLTTHQCKLAATYEANKKLCRKGRGVPVEELPTIAERLCAREGTQEVVHYYFKRQPSGRGRPILDYGIENRALQKLVNRAMEPFVTLHPNQYAYFGGREAACQALEEAVKDGFVWVTEIDVRDCYPSFDEERIHSFLPIPRGLVDRVILATNLNLVPYNTRRDWGARSGVRTGLPQGSATSALVAEILLRPAVETLPDNVRLINYADNIWVLTRTRAEACASQTLSDALARHPAGPLRPRVEPFRLVNWGFPFLGYWVKAQDGTVTFEPVEAKFEEFRRVLGEHLQEDGLALIEERRHQTKAEDYAKSFWASYKRFRYSEATRDRYLRDVGNEKAIIEAIMRDPEILVSLAQGSRLPRSLNGERLLIEFLRRGVEIDLRV